MGMKEKEEKKFLSVVVNYAKEKPVLYCVRQGHESYKIACRHDDSKKKSY